MKPVTDGKKDDFVDSSANQNNNQHNDEDGKLYKILGYNGFSPSTVSLSMLLMMLAAAIVLLR